MQIWLADQIWHQKMSEERNEKKWIIGDLFLFIKMKTLSWNQNIYFDESIEQMKFHQYSPLVRTNLDTAFSDIYIEINDHAQFLLPR